MLVTRHKLLIDQVYKPLATWLAGLGVSPMAITLISPVLTAGVCWWFIHARAVVPFCLGILAVGALDGLDGAVARVSGRVTKFGAYVDALCDRYFETTIALRVSYVTGFWLLGMASLAGALLVSYAKARAAIEVNVSNTEWPDFMERAERSVLYVGGLLAWDLLPEVRLWGPNLFWWSLAAMTVLTHATVIQRALRARRFIAARSS